VGADSLVAAGNSNYLKAGTAANTLVGSSLSSATTVLEGNGRSTLRYAGANNTFLINNSVAGGSGWDYKTDSIVAAGSASANTSTIRTTLNRFDLSNTTNHGAGVANIRNIMYTGRGDVTLQGNNQNNWIQGGTGNNSLVAGTGRSTLDSGISTRNNTLVGNGLSSLIGGVGNDTFRIIAGDKISEIATGGTDLVSLTGSASTYNLANTASNGIGIVNVENLVYAGTASNVTLQGNTRNNSIRGASGNTNNFLGGAGGSDTLNASASSGSNTLVGSANAGSSLIGGSGRNTFYTYNANDSITAGGSSTNTVISNSSKVDLSTQSGSLQFDTIGYTGYGNVTLIGNSRGGTTLNAGNAFASTLGDGGSTTADRLIGSAKGSNLFTVSSINAHTVTGGIGRDTLQVTTAQTSSNDQFSKITGVEVLSLAGSGNKVTLNGNARSNSGIDTVILSAGSNTIDAGSYTSGANITINASANTSANTLTGGAGDDRFILRGGNLGLNGSSLRGNSGTDTLQLQNASTLTGFGSNVTGIEVLSLAGGGNNISAIGNSGVTLITGGTGGDTIDASTAATSLSINSSASRLGNLFTASAVNGIATSISGGSGVDTLSVSAGGNYGDTLFTDDTSIEVLRISGASDTKVSLAGGAYAAGIATVIGGSGKATIDASKFNDNAPPTKNLVIDTTANTTVGASYTGSVGNDLIRIANSTVLNASTVKGGSGIDTLQITNAAIITTIDSAKISSVEVLSLSGGNNSISGIGGAGIQTIIGGSGRDSIDASNSTRGIYVTGAASTLGVSLVAANGQSSTLIGSSQSDIFRVGGSSTSAVLTGGAGIDTLFAEKTSLSAGSFDTDTSIEVLQLGLSSEVTLDSGAKRAGIATVIGGSGNDTLDASLFNSDASPSRGLFVDLSKNATNPGANGSSYTTSGGNDTIRVKNFSIFNGAGSAVTKLNGGAGIDTLQISDTNAILSGLSGKVSKIEVLSLAGGNNNISGMNGTGITTIIGGAGKDTIDVRDATTLIFVNGGASTLGDSLLASNVNGVASTLIGSKTAGNTFVVGSQAALQAASLVGATTGGLTGRDTLQYAGSAITAGDFAKSTLAGSLDLLSLTGSGGGRNFVLGNDARLAGITSVIGGAGGGDTLDASAYTAGSSIWLDASRAATTNTLISGGAQSTLIGSTTAANAFYLSNTGNLATSSLVGNLTKNDTLALTSGLQTFYDTQIGGARMRSIEIISLSGGGNVVGLGVNAQTAGITSLIGGTGPDNLSAAGMTRGNIYIDGGLGTAGNTLAAGVGTSKATLIGNGSSTATNYFQITNAALLGNNSLVGGSASTDILQFTTTGQVLADAAFAKASGTANLDGLLLTGGGNRLVLGATAQNAFSSIFTVTGGAAGADTIDASGIATSSVYIDGSSARTGSTLIAGSNANTLIGGAVSTANNLFVFKSAGALTGSSIVGGGGTNTLQLEANAQSISSFSQISQIDVLNIKGALNSVDLTGADNAGISTVVGGTGPNTVDGSAFSAYNDILTYDFRLSSGGDSLVGGQTGNLFQIKDGGNLLNSTISGALIGVNATDTLQLMTGGQTLGDNAFKNQSNVGLLTLAGGVTGNRVTLDGFASSAGISSVIGGASRDTIDARTFSGTSGIFVDGSKTTGASLLGSTSVGNTLIGGTNADNVFFLDGIANNSIVGGSAGRDTLNFSAQTTIVRGDLDSLSGIGALQFNEAGNSVVLGTDALIAGIRTIIGGQGNDTGSTFNTSAYKTAAVLFQITDQNYLANSAITGGQGVDTLKFSRDGVSITDTDIDNLSSIQVLQTANGNNRILISDRFATLAGFSTIIGGTGRDTVDITDSDNYNPTLGSSTLTYDFSKGTGYSFIGSIENLPYTRIVGGTGTNNVQISNAGIITDNLFTNQYQANIGTLDLSDDENTASSLTLGTKASGAKIRTVNLGSHASLSGLGSGDTLDVRGYTSATNIVIAGGTGDDLVQTSFSELSSFTFNGNAGNDSLQIVGSNARAIAALAGGFDALVLNDGNNFVNLTANTAGISSIYGGKGVDTISLRGVTTGVNMIVNYNRLGRGSNNASLVGGLGIDTLSIGSGGLPADNVLLDDNAFARTASIEALALNEQGSNNVVLGTNAQKAGIRTIYGSTFDGITGGNDTLDASGFGAAVKFVIADVPTMTTDTLIGSAFIDTLALSSDSQLIDDALFAQIDPTQTALGRRVDKLEVLQLANGDNSVTLDVNATAAGIQTVIGGTGEDSFTMTSKIVAANSIVGGLGNDSIILSNGGVTVLDSAFTKVSSVELFQTADGDNSVTIGTMAIAAGITTLVGGKGNDSFTMTTTILSANSLNGGSGTDTIILSNSASGIRSLTDADFTKISSVEVLKTANGNNDITIGVRAEAARISEVIGGTGNDIFDASDLTSGVTLDGGGRATTNDELTGGSEADLFVLANTGQNYYGTSATAIGASNFARITNFSNNDILQLNSTESYTFGVSTWGDRTLNRFGLYDSNGFVGDITTDRSFSLTTNGAQDAGFLADTSKVQYV
jgi:Ca2+-binding RTX toxin-like protein